jgi:hypothetical protein
LRRQHGGVQPGPVGTDDDHVFAASQPGLMQAAGHMLHQRGQVGPAVGLPDAIFFFAHGRRAAALGGVLEQKSWERGQHGWYLVSRVKLPGNKKSGFAVVP